MTQRIDNCGCTSKNFSLLAGLLVAIYGCGPGLNPNQMLVPDAQRSDLEFSLSKAQIAYDQGKFEDAEKYVNRALSVSSDNEKAALLSSYVNLALVGMETFRLILTLIDQGQSEQVEGTKSKSAAGLLDEIGAVLNVTDTDLQSLGTIDDAGDLELFRPFKLIVPKSFSETRSSQVVLFQRLDRAIRALCPFVQEDVLLKDADPRQNCVKTVATTRSFVLVHVAWSFLHLAEATAFYRILFFKNEDKDLPNLQERSAALTTNRQSLSIGSYAEHAVSLAGSVDKILAFTDEASLFSGTLNDLVTTTNGLKGLGLPAKVTASITAATDSILSAKDQFSGESDEAKKLQSLKSQLTKSIADDLSKSIKELAAANPTEFADQKVEICGAYGSISAGQNIPKECE